MINKKEIKENYDKLFKLVVKYREFPVKYNLKIDTHTKIKAHGTIDLTYDDHQAALVEADNVEFDIEAPHDSIYKALEDECINLWQFVESFGLDELDDILEKNTDEFWDQAKPYLDFFKPSFNEDLSQIEFIDDMYMVEEEQMLEKLYGWFDPEVRIREENIEKLYKYVRDALYNKDFKKIKKILDKAQL